MREGTWCVREKSVFEREQRPSERRRTCMLMVSHSCNLNCTYCYEHHKDGKKMSFDVAKKAILEQVEFVKKSDDFDELEIDFMGGEPFTNFPLIRKVVEWLETEADLEIPWISFATTNGTLLSDEVKQWLRSHRRSICLGASYDGESAQGTNRGETARRIDLTFFHEQWPFQDFHMTVSRASLPFLAKNILKSSYPLNAALAQGANWTREDAQIFFEQLSELSRFYLNEGSEEMPINLLLRSLEGLASSPEEPQRRFCGSGTGMITYDVDGKTYGCHMFTPVVLAENALELSSSNANCCDDALEDPRCEKCLLKHYCPSCLGFNFRYRGSTALRDSSMCLMFLAEVRASCEFQLRYFAKNQPKTPRDASILKAAVEVWPRIKDVDLSSIQSPFNV